MSNNHAQDRYDPPNIGSEYEEQIYGDVVKGEVFRLEPRDSAKSYRKVDEIKCHDIHENVTAQFEPKTKVYVKS